MKLSYYTVLHKHKEFKTTGEIQAGVLEMCKSSRSYKIKNKKAPFL